MTTAWAYTEDLVFDRCAEVWPSDGVGPAILDVDLRSEPKFLVANEEEWLAWGDSITEIEEDLREIEQSPPAPMPRYRRFSMDELLNVVGQIDFDLLPQDLLSEVENEWPPLDRSFTARFTSFSAVVASASIHLCLFLFCAFVSLPQVAGAAGNAGNVISVRITAPEDLIPQDESPASVDSAASMPSTAGKSTWRRKPPPPQATEPPSDLRQVGPRPEKFVMQEKPKHDERKEQQTQPDEDKAKRIGEQESGEDPQNSIASLPSTASAERRFIPAAGPEGEAFESMVLSAIREVIFFPKKAAIKRHHGEVVVELAINKDGTISSLRIVKTSESPILDEAALKIIRNAAKKFPPIPDSLHRERIDYVVPILFKEKRG